MKRWGATLLVLGIVSFVLPLVGMQLQFLNLFGPESQPLVGALMATVGGALLVIATVQERRLAGSTGQAPATGIPASSEAGTGAAMAGIISTPSSSSAVSSARRCGKCGQAMRAGDEFCERCGTKVARAAPPAPAAQSSAPPPPPSLVTPASAALPAPSSRSTKRACPNPKCGRTMAKDKKFCTACGTRLVA